MDSTTAAKRTQLLYDPAARQSIATEASGIAFIESAALGPGQAYAKPQHEAAADWAAATFHVDWAVAPDPPWEPSRSGLDSVSSSLEQVLHLCLGRQQDAV